MRNAFVDKITELAAKDERIVLLVGDLGYKIFDDFKEKYPNRFYNVGIAEANMVSMAAGMALEGFKPFVYSIVPFITLRCCEQIRNDLAYHRKNVVIVGMGGGYSYGHNGPTHHGIEDIAILRVMPNMTVACPCDPKETAVIVEELAKQDGPAYLRLSNVGGKSLHHTEPKIRLGKGRILRYGSDIVLLSTGNMLLTTWKVCKILTNSGISCGVVTMPFVKPLDKATIQEISQRTPVVVTLEEHNIIGGFGSAVAEYLMESGESVLFKRFGIKDHFSDLSGDKEYLRDAAGLSPKKIVEEIRILIENQVSS